jgi:hypothetical protein
MGAFFSISGSESVEMFIRVDSARVRDLSSSRLVSAHRPSSSSTSFMHFGRAHGMGHKDDLPFMAPALVKVDAKARQVGSVAVAFGF